MSSQFQRLGFRRFGWAEEPGFARAQPTLRARSDGLKEGARGGTLGAPVPGRVE